MWVCPDLAFPKAVSKLTALSELSISTGGSSVHDNEVFEAPLQLSPMPLAVPGLRHLKLTEGGPFAARAPFSILLPGQIPGNSPPFPISTLLQSKLPKPSRIRNLECD